MADKLYLVSDNRDGVNHLVFTWEDPRKAGYRGEVIEGVTLDYDMDRIHTWDKGDDRPETCVGRLPDNPKHYQVFRRAAELSAAGYEVVPGSPVVFGRWSDYMKLHGANDLPEDAWFGELDRIEQAAKQRRQRTKLAPAPKSADRDAVAEWIAKQHLLVDVGVREVRYLPRQSPPDEIRLLEVNDVIATPETPAEAVDFGLDIEGTKFRLLVADVTSEQLETIKRDPTYLPSGWSLDDFKSWRRGA